MLGLYVNLYTNSFKDKIVILTLFLSCLYKKCYIIKQLLTIESLNMMISASPRSYSMSQ